MSPRALTLSLLVALTAASVVFFGGVEGWLSSSLVAAVCALAALCLLPCLRGRMRLPNDPLLGAGLLVVAAALLTTAWSANRFLTLQWTLRLLAAVAAYAIAAHVTPSRRAARGAILVLVALATLTAAYGILVTLSGREVVLWTQKPEYRDSLTGTFINRNHFATYLLLHLFPLLGLAVAVRRPHLVRVLPALAVMLLALALTLSRGGVLAFTVALPCFLWLLDAKGRRRLAWPVAALAVALAALALTNYPRLHARLATAADAGSEPSAAARLSLWRSTLRAFADRPLLGFGAGTFSSFYPRYREVGIARRVTYAHQEYLEVLAEQGLVGAAALALALVLLVRSFRRARASLAAEDRTLGAGLVSGFLALAVHAAVDFPLKIPAVLLCFAVLLGLLVALARRPGEEPSTLPAAGPRAAAFAAALILVAAAARAAASAVVERELDRASLLFAEPDWDGAAKAYARASRLDPLNPEALNGLARTELNRAKFRGRADAQARERLATQALTHFAAAERLDPMVGDYNLSRAWLFNFLGRPEQAALEYDLAMRDDPANANVLYHAASFHLHQGNIDRGLELLRQGLESWYKFFGGKIAEVHHLVKDPDRVLAILPEAQPFLAYQYAVFLLERGEAGPAHKAFARAVAGAGWREDWLIYFAGLVARKQSLQEALALYDEVPPRAKGPAVTIEVAKMRSMTGDRDGAIESLALGLESRPKDPELLRTLAVYAGDAAVTREALARYREAAGEDLGYLVAAATLALGRQDLEGAVDLLERARALDPASPHVKGGLARVYRALAAHAYASGRCAESEVLDELARATD